MCIEVIYAIQQKDVLQICLYRINSDTGNLLHFQVKLLILQQNLCSTICVKASSSLNFLLILLSVSQRACLLGVCMSQLAASISFSRAQPLSLPHRWVTPAPIFSCDPLRGKKRPKNIKTSALHEKKKKKKLEQWNKISKLYVITAAYNPSYNFFLK